MSALILAVTLISFVGIMGAMAYWGLRPLTSKDTMTANDEPKKRAGPPPKIITVDPHDLIPYANNPRINDATVPVVRRSMEKYGYNNMILVTPDMVVVAGHTRLKSLLEMGVNEIEVQVLEHLDDEGSREFRLVDNRTQEMSGYDMFKLGIELKGTPGLDKVGFNLDFPDLDFAISGKPPESHTKQAYTIAEDEGTPLDDDSGGFSVPDLDFGEAPSKKETRTIICPHCGEEIEIDF